MKKIMRFNWVFAVTMLMATTLSSFSHFMGAHSFQVYLDDDMILDQYVNASMEIPTVRVDPAKSYSQLVVKYSECGRTVSGRKITIRDDNNNFLKDWRFEGSTAGYKDPMTCAVKDVVALKPKGSNVLRLYYSSNEFPEGQQFTRLLIEGEASTALK